MPVIETKVFKNETFLKREDYHKNLFWKTEGIKSKMALGGGLKAIEKHKAKGKMTARERIDLLLDQGARLFEFGALAGYEMYPEHGGAPGAGVVTGIGKVSGKDCVIVANDATVKAGAWFPITCKKNLRAQEICMENYLPIIYLVDSAGVYLPMQDEIFPDKEHFGRIFRNNAQISAMGIPQISAIMGPCVAGGAYLPIMSDEALIVEGEGSVFLAGAHLVKAAIGEVISNEKLGGARVQSNLSGVTDYIMKDDAECIATIRSLVDKINLKKGNIFGRKTPVEPAYPIDELYGVLPEDTNKAYDMREVIARITDNSEVEEYKSGYGKSIITAWARIDGWSVGIVANQREIIKSEKGEMQVGGVIYSDSADKAARFIMNCNQRNVPILFLQDVTGFMVGSRAEHGGIIKDVAKMVNAVANSVVPKITIIIGNSFGAGNYAMCGKAYDPRFIYALPSAKIAVMGGLQAANVLSGIRIQQLEKLGKELSAEDKQILHDEVVNEYDAKSSPVYAASRLWIDEVISPVQIRQYVSQAIEVANYKPFIEPFKMGVVQV
ncbi:MAG: acyl-CoA carboxylase subunit beta [Ignavibacteriales bacterium]|nr:acyl-CoA carboxylase subunit beta [Ignavibacteriales bacterium]